MDFVTGYRSTAVTNTMTEKKWITRFIFLESVAGVPGMVAGMLRHLKSIRRLKRDHGWYALSTILYQRKLINCICIIRIETLLEEAYNERMHLLTFLKLSEPGRSMRLMVLGSQCVFFTGFSIAYLLSPRICHRFVGYLEEEAVITYTKAITDLDSGLLPKWEETTVPDMAVKYWQMPEGKRDMRSLLLYVRADEAKHRDVNHTLGSLDQDRDCNPFSAKFRAQAGKAKEVLGENMRGFELGRKERV